MILYLLLDEPSYGYEVSKRITEMSEERYIMKETTLYSSFNRLQKNGFIESFAGTESNGKARTYYKLTPQGLQHYREKCREWKLTREVVEKFIKDV